MDFCLRFVENGGEGGLNMGNKNAYRIAVVRNPIKFIFRMKMAVHFCMAAHHLIGRRMETEEAKWYKRRCGEIEMNDDLRVVC